MERRWQAGTKQTTERRQGRARTKAGKGSRGGARAGQGSRGEARAGQGSRGEARAGQGDPRKPGQKPFCNPYNKHSCSVSGKGCHLEAMHAI